MTTLAIIRNALIGIQKPLNEMTDKGLAEFFGELGIVICSAAPAGWTTRNNLKALAAEGVVGVATECGDVVREGEGWANANEPLFSLCQ